MELGVVTFVHRPTGVSPERRMRALLEEARLADDLGLDVFAIAEHQRPGFVVSSPADRARPRRRGHRAAAVSSAMTVLWSDDPVRVFQQFATVDLISGGRVEIRERERVTWSGRHRAREVAPAVREGVRRRSAPTMTTSEPG